MTKPTNIRSMNNPIATRFGYMLRRASAAMMSDLGTALAEIGLRPVEATILFLVGANWGCSQSDLGRTLGIQRANMAPLVAALAARGYLRKAVDGRSLALSLTKEGEAACAHAKAIVDAHEARFQRLLAGQDADRLRAAIALIATGAAYDPAE